MSQKAPSGLKRSLTLPLTAGVVVTGALVLALLITLRENEHYEPPFSSDPVNVSPEAAKLELKQLDSKTIKNWISEKMKSSGASVGVVNIWATWCEPCRQEMPELAKFRKTGAIPLFLISADNEVDEPIVRSFLVEKGVDFESAIIKGDQQEFIETWQKLSSKDVARRWSMSLPVTFLIGRAGNVISFSVGTTTAARLSDLVKKTVETLRAKDGAQKEAENDAGKQTGKDAQKED